MDSATAGEAELRERVRQQEVVAELGQRALETDDLERFLREASRAAAETLDAEYATLLELRPDGAEFSLRQGHGWTDEIVGRATVPVDADSQAGYALRREEPVIVDALAAEERFSGPELFASRGVESGICATVGSVENPWGVFGVHTTDRREFDGHDAVFVRSVANVLASTIENEGTRAEIEEIYGRISDAFYALDEEWRFAHANERAEELIDVGGEGLEGKRVWNLFEWAADSKLRLEYERAMETQEPASFEFYYPEPLDAWYEVHAYPSETGLSVYFRDVTDRKDRERELRERERELRETKRRLELALEGTNTGLWEWNAAMNEVTWNETLERAVGLEPGAFDGTFEAFARRLHPDDVSRIEAALDEAIETGELYRIEFRMRHEDGGWRWADVRGRVVSGEDGTGRMIGIYHDITRRKEREQQLRERRLELKRYAEYTDAVLDAIDDVFYVLDENGNPQRWNESLVEATGFTHDEIGGMNALEFFDEDERARVADAIAEVFETGEARVDSALTTKAGARVPYEFVATALEDLDGNQVAAGIGRDIGDRVEKEGQLSRLISNIPGFVYRVENAPGWPTEFVSEGVSEMTGYDRAAFERGDVTWDDVTLDRHDRIWDDVQAALDEGEPFHLVFPIETAGGEWRWVKEQGRGVYADDGSVEALEGVVTDVTERVAYERELERARHLLEQSQRLAQVGAWELALDGDGGREMAATDEVHRVHGLSPGADFELRDAGEFYRPEDWDRLRAAVEDAIERDEPYDMEIRLTTADGDERWARAIGEPVFADEGRPGWNEPDSDGEVVAVRGAFQDITERKRRETELERTKNMLQQAQRMTGVAGWEVDVSDGSPYTPRWTGAIYELFEVPRGAPLDVAEVNDFFHLDDPSDGKTAFDRALEGGGGWDHETRLTTAAGNERWVHSTGEPVVEDGELVKLRGSIQDVTDQKERELALESLHEATRGLLGTETEAEIADLVVDAAEDALGVPSVAVYLLDGESNRLEPTAFSPGFVGLCEGTPSAATRDSMLWDAFVGGMETAFTEASIFDRDVEGGVALPIGDHGVFVVAAPSSPIDSETRRLVETLVATTVAAFDRLESESTLRKRDAELEARNRRLRQHQQITDIIRRIDQSLIGADGREELEAAVCERLVEAETVAFAWIGAYDAGGTAVVPRRWAGAGEGYLDAVSLDDAASGAEPAVVAARREEPIAVPNVVDELKAEAWRKPALADGFHSVVSVPLSFDEYVYGVLTVYADEPNGFGDLERTVFAELGENIANSINAVETRQALHTDAAVEVTLRFDEPEAFLSNVARRTESRVEYEGLATDSDDETRLFFTTGGDAADVAATLDDLLSVTDHWLVSESNGRALFGAAVAGDVVASRLVRHGGSPQSIRATPSEMEIVVDVPTTVDVREFVEMLRDRYPSAQLVGRRDVRRDARLRRRRGSSLVETLTERQREILQTAYFAGFFEWPRESTGEDVAEMLDVSQPTVNRHLRLGQQRLLEQLFGGAGTAIEN